MKKLVTKTLFIAFLCSAAMPNAMQANSVVDWVKSVPTRFVDWGKPVLTMSRLNNHPVVASGLLYGKRAVRFGKRVTMLTAAGAVISGVLYGAFKIGRHWGSQPKYDYKKLFDALLKKYKAASVPEEKVQEIFESDEVQEYMPKWSIPTTGTRLDYAIFPSWRIRFIEDFIRHYEKEKVSYKTTTAPTSINVPTLYGIEYRDEACKKVDEVSQVLSIATRYLEYLKQPWVTNRDLTFAGLGGLGIAVTGVVALKLAGK